MDALPAQRWVFFTSKLGALMLVQVVICLGIVVAGVTTQLVHGYTRFEFGVYFKELFLIWLVQNCITCAFAILVHTLVNHKYLGYFAVVVLYIGVIPLGLPAIGIEHYPMRFGRIPHPGSSDMTGFTLFCKSFVCVELYWSLTAV